MGIFGSSGAPREDNQRPQGESVHTEIVKNERDGMVFWSERPVPNAKPEEK